MNDSLTRKVKGGRRAFFENPEADRLLAMLLRFLTEHWALKERVMSLEAVLVEHGVLTAEQLESFEPTAELGASWDQESYALIQAVIEAAQNIEK